MSLKKGLSAIAAIVAILPVVCSAYPDPVPSVPPDPLAQIFEAIRQARERSERVGETLGNMTTPEVYEFYTRRNDLYKHNLMKALGAYDALAFLRPIEEARGMDPQVIMNRLRTEADPIARATLIARLPNSAAFDVAGAEAVIRRRIGELAMEAAKLKTEEEKYRKERDRIESELTAAKRRVPRNAEEIQAILEEKWGVLEKIETIHRRLVGLAIEGNLLRDYALATNKDAKMAGIARGLGNDLRLFVGEVRAGEPIGGMRKLWSDIQASIAANRAALAMPYQPGQSFNLLPLEPGDIRNPLSPGLPPPLSVPADAPPPLSIPAYVSPSAPGTMPYVPPTAIALPARPTAPRPTGPRRLPPPRTPRLR